MSPKFNPFTAEVEITVIDSEGKATGEKRILTNPSIAHLYPDEPQVLINWFWGKQKGYKVSQELISTPIEFEGQLYHGDWMWGSMVKPKTTNGVVRGYTVGLVHDLISKIGKKAEDGQRGQRYLDPNALWGAGTGTLRVMSVPAGSKYNGLPIEDGFGYITKTAAAIVYNGADKIHLSKARDSFHFWQRVPWTAKVAAESIPLIEANLIDMANPANWEFEGSTGLAEKAALCKIDPIMAEHPIVANAMSRTSQERAVRLATTVPTDSRTYLAVPTTDKSLNCNGKSIVTGYPIDAWGSMKAYAVKDADQAEMKRITEMEVVQYTLASRKVFAKGCLGIVDDARLGGYDLIVCSDDVKMGKLTAEALKDVYLGFTAYWAAGSSMGIEAKAWKKQGRDFDGDTMQKTDCSKRPALFHEVQKFPEQDTLKLDKTNNPMNKRAEMIERSMTSIVGFATNVMADTFVYEARAFLAERLGYSDMAALDKQLNWGIKVGTDGFKTNVDMAKTEKQCAILQSNILKLTGSSAPWTKWASDGWSFKHGIPAWLYGGEDANAPEVKAGIPADFDGTIAQILRITLPNIEAFMKVGIVSQPLSAFLNWVPNVSEETYHLAEEVQVAFNTRVVRVNWSDAEEVASFRAWWKKAAVQWLKKNHLTEVQGAAALWRVAHSARGTYAGAASVFYAFPEMCNRFIADKPGLKEAQGGGGIKTVCFGLNSDVEKAICKCKVVTFEEVRGNARITRKALELADKKLLQGTLAAIPTDKPQPEKGEYTAYLTKRSDKSWFVTLTSI